MPSGPPAPLQIPWHDLLRPGCPCFRPSAPFSTRMGEAALREAAAGTNGDPIPRPLSIAIHFPCRARLRDGGGDARSESLLARLRRELALLGSCFDRDRQVEEIHLLNQPLAHFSPEQIRDLLDTVARHFSFAVTGAPLRLVELIPAPDQTVNLSALAAAGISHAAVFADATAGTASEPPASIRAAATRIDDCRRQGIAHVHAHLAGCRNAATPACLLALDAIVSARPDRITLHQALRRDSSAADAQEAPCVASCATPCEPSGLREALFSRLLQSGYQHLGLCSFALPGDELIQARQRNALHCNLLGYSASSDSDLVGVGVGANSHVGATLCQNHRDPAAWEESIDAGRLPIWRGTQLSPDDLLRADAVQQLVCRGQIDFVDLARAHDIYFQRRFAHALERLKSRMEEGLVLLTPQGVCATALGQQRLHLLIDCFDEIEGRRIEAAPCPPPRAP